MLRTCSRSADWAASGLEEIVARNELAKARADMKKSLASGLIAVAMGGATLMWYGAAMDDDWKLSEGSPPGAAFFESPEQAVAEIRKMQGEEDWASLARYYDLEGSGIDRETLVSGEFFIRTERPEVAHPGEFWRYKHPFAPSFEYAFTTPAAEAGVVIVRVAVKIDQGSDSPAQEGWQEFSMRQSEAGFQVLTGDAEPVALEELLADPGPPSPGLPEG